MTTTRLRRVPLQPGEHSLRHRIERLVVEVDLVLIAAVVALAGLGVVLVYSATELDGPPQLAGYAWRQATWVVLGLGVMAAVMAVDYRRIQDRAATLYLVSIGLLLAVMTPLGTSGGGAQRWIDLGAFRLQPSEVAEITLVVAIAALCHRHTPIDASRLVGSLTLAAVPLALVLLQPNIGSALVFGVIVVVVLFAAGAAARHLALLATAAAATSVAVVRLGVLAEYQQNRLVGFLNPGADASGIGYNVDQSMVAIGAGGLTGRGLFQGSQTQRSFVPAQHTDFVFTVAAEELGFIGSAAVLALFGVVVWRLLRIAGTALDTFGALVCIGVGGIIVFKVFQNIGMASGIMPITGIPLPFLSYGGSATIVSFAAIGLALNVGMRRHR